MLWRMCVPDSADVWSGMQIQSVARQTAAAKAGLPQEKVQIHTVYLGGGFGRRGGADFIGEAVEISKAAGVPVKLQWTREDDLQHDTYRPASYTKFASALDEKGMPTVWNARVVCPSFAGLRNGVDRTGVEGIAEIRYAIPNILVEYHPPDVGIPTSYWRSVGYSHNTFFTESFLDELAVAAKQDPVEFRRKLLSKAPRMLGVLELAAEKAGWGKPLSGGPASWRCSRGQPRKLQCTGSRDFDRQRKTSRASRGLRRRLRVCRESVDCGAADRKRHRVRFERRCCEAKSRSTAVACSRRTSTITNRSGLTRCQ